MQFKRIRLSGFKSFVDPTELLIEPGMTGVVGPNGCGKSNILEAIRWVMGESSPKSMRSDGMDDVIFAGTTRRAPRNLAEVTLVLDNSEGTAPAQFKGMHELEVSRRIERDSGSAYRVNGQEVRAKDVQLLFADAATGAHSPALVSQGTIGSLINAKPQGRRAILEEAAGIVGLHRRRKEAENRLKAAGNNLTRLEDVMSQMEAHRASLKKQARQATRYRNISGDIQRAEATLLFLKWKAADEALLDLGSRLRKFVAVVADKTRAVSALTRDHDELAEKLPALRQAEAGAGAALHRLTVARENLDQEEERRQQRKDELTARLTQIADDRLREEHHAVDADEALKRLANEGSVMPEAQNKSLEEEAAQTVATAESKASSAEVATDSLSTEIAQKNARREALEIESAGLKSRIARLQAEAITNEVEAEELASGEGDESGFIKAQKRYEQSEIEFDKANAALAGLEGKRLNSIDERDAARAKVSEQRGKLSGLAAEIQGLEDLLAAQNHDDGSAPVADGLEVDAGYEIALGAALGDDLNAPESETSTVGWRQYPAIDQALPRAADPLGNHVRGVKSLERRLSQTGVVSQTDGEKLAGELKPGQRLVSKDGALWRWDGYVRSEDAPSGAILRIAQKARLHELEDIRQTTESQVTVVESSLMEKEDAVDAALEAERAVRNKRAEKETQLNHARQALREIQDQGSERVQKLGALKEAEVRISRDIVESRERRKSIEQDIPGTSTGEDDTKALEAARAKMEQLRSELASTRAEYDGIIRSKTEREERIAAMKREGAAWQERSKRAKSQLDELGSRESEAKTTLAGLDLAPEELEQKRQKLLNHIDEAEKLKTMAVEKLAKAESALTAKDKDLKSAEAMLGEAREEKVRVETSHENAGTKLAEIVAAIKESFKVKPDALFELAELKPDKNLPELDAMERRLDRLKAERERLGAVNLRADEELKEIDEQLEHLVEEKTDLETAIARLRQGIGSLNREGRDRMRAAFDEVNQHFGELFQQLFGGGKAHLALVESDDPLEAGLEIMASPPGKKLQVMSLLSGGEQALTAIALIFAVFMTNPAPICVLDEVDAPLDDANVERFCDLLHDISSKSNTRFLIVTHNAVTMARMDRLFGVTMAEQGVSQLVSVDLERAEALRAVG